MAGVIRSAADRKRLIEAYEASGLSAKVFSEREKIPASTLYQWLSDRRAPRKAPRIARVIRRSEVARAAPAKATEPVVLEVGGVRVRVGVDFDRHALGAVLDVLEARAVAGR